MLTEDNVDDWIVVAITDANFARYGIKPEELKKAMNRNPKVHSALICIGEGTEANWQVFCRFQHMPSEADSFM